MISKQTRQQVRTVYAFRCGYCGVSETESGAELTIDHFQPQVRGGTDAFSNLVYSCFACNGFKSDAWDVDNPTVLYPMQNDMKEHVAEQDDGTLHPLTERGRLHIEQLHLNRHQLIEQRRGRQLLQGLLEQQQSTNEQIRDVQQDVQTLLRTMPRRKKRRASPTPPG